MIQKSDKNIKYFEDIQDWVMQYADDPNPTHAQFSGADVAHMIVSYNREKLAGKLKNIDKNKKSCDNCKYKNDYPKCYTSNNVACVDWGKLPTKK